MSELTTLVIERPRGLPPIRIEVDPGNGFVTIAGADRVQTEFGITDDGGIGNVRANGHLPTLIADVVKSTGTLEARILVDNPNWWTISSAPSLNIGFYPPDTKGFRIQSFASGANRLGGICVMDKKVAPAQSEHAA